VTTVRALFDLDAWLTSGNGATLTAAQKKFWEMVAKKGEDDGLACDCERVYHLPTSLHNPRKRPFWSRDASPPLPKVLQPLEPKEEKMLLQSIIHDLMSNFGVSLNPEPNLDRGVETLADLNGVNRIFVIGASHMLRAAEFLPPNAISMAYPGFLPDQNKIAELSTSLAGGGPGEQDVVILDLLSNIAFMGSDTDGLPTPAIRAGDGRYHIVGALTTAPPTALKKALEACMPLADAAKGNRVIFVHPIPRYVKTKCCDDPSHITNFVNDDYEEDLMEQHRKILGGGQHPRVSTTKFLMLLQ
jgi:hypothetical protein